MSEGSPSSCSRSDRLRLHNVTPLDPGQLQLPDHITREARRLLRDSASDNPITEYQARPLIQSTCIWLLRQGVINTEDSPGVFSTVSEMLHDMIQVNQLQVPAGCKRPVDFGTRIKTWFGNYVTRRKTTFQLEVAHDEALNTPLRDLDAANRIKVMGEFEEPMQGHSARSVLGKGRVLLPFSPTRLDRTEMGKTLNESELEEEVTERPRDGDPGPRDGAPGDPVTKAKPNVNNLNVRSMFENLASAAGLDVSIGYGKRADGAGNLPKLPTFNVLNTEEERKKTTARAAKPRAGTAQTRAGAAPPRAVAAPPGAVAAPPRAKTARKASPAAPEGDNAHLPAKAQKRGSKKNPNVPFSLGYVMASEQCSIGSKYTVHTGDVCHGKNCEQMFIIYYMEYPDCEQLWFVGPILNLSKNGKWADVGFSDGKLWCKLNLSERGVKWVCLLPI